MMLKVKDCVVVSLIRMAQMFFADFAAQVNELSFPTLYEILHKQQLSDRKDGLKGYCEPRWA
jgi:hypothetical protein